MLLTQKQSDDVYTLPMAKFKHRQTFTRLEQLQIVEEVLIPCSSSITTSRLNRVSKYLGISAKLVKQMMYIYPVLLVLNGCYVVKSKLLFFYFFIFLFIFFPPFFL